MISQAKDRFTLIGYDRDGRVIYGLSGRHKYSDRWWVYVCPVCDSETGFECTDFKKHAASAFSNLMHPDQQAMEQEAAPHLTDENAFLDFYCQGCNGVVRTYYRYEPVGERWGDRLELTIVVERSETMARPC